MAGLTELMHRELGAVVSVPLAGILGWRGGGERSPQILPTSSFSPLGGDFGLAGGCLILCLESRQKVFQSPWRGFWVGGHRRLRRVHILHQAFQSPWRGFWVGGGAEFRACVMCCCVSVPLAGILGWRDSLCNSATKRWGGFSPLGGDFGLAGIAFTLRFTLDCFVSVPLAGILGWRVN